MRARRRVRATGRAVTGPTLDDTMNTLKAPGEPVAWLQAFGQDPSSPDFGGVRLQTNHGDSTSIGGHSDYFKDDTESLENVVVR